MQHIQVNIISVQIQAINILKTKFQKVSTSDNYSKEYFQLKGHEQKETGWIPTEQEQDIYTQGASH